MVVGVTKSVHLFSLVFIVAQGDWADRIVYALSRPALPVRLFFSHCLTVLNAVPSPL